MTKPRLLNLPNWRQPCWWGKDPRSLPATHARGLHAQQRGVYSMSTQQILIGSYREPGSVPAARSGVKHTPSLSASVPPLVGETAVHCANAARSMQTLMGKGQHRLGKKCNRGLTCSNGCWCSLHTHTRHTCGLRNTDNQPPFLGYPEEETSCYCSESENFGLPSAIFGLPR